MNSDRFRFRVYDNQCGEYIRTCLNDDGTLQGIPTDDKRFVIEQCTGERDRNRELIFEGDVVRDIDDNEFYVSFYSGRFEVDSAENYVLFPEWQEFSIVGNIHGAEYEQEYC